MKKSIIAMLEWTCHARAAKVVRPMLSHIVEWVGEYANACEALPYISTMIQDTNYAQKSSDKQKSKNSQQQVDVIFEQDGNVQRWRYI